MKYLFIFIILFSVIAGWGCTIGIINGSATTDGRPVLWKSRGAGSNVQVFHEDSFTYQYVGSGNGGSEYAWMGVNEAGFAIANAMVNDLDRLPGNGDCMLQALRNYSTIDEFLAFLDSTNVTGRETHTCYVAFDATGTAVVIEAGTNEYWVYDTAEAEYGFMVRTYFSYAGSGPPGSDDVMTATLTDLAQAGDFNWQDIFPTVIRGFFTNEYEQVEIPFNNYWDDDTPYGYVGSQYSNNSTGFTSVALIQGVQPGEEPSLSTMWTILGPPTCGIAAPFWPLCPEIPQAASANPTTPLNDRALEVKDIIYNLSPSSYADSYVLSNSDENGYWDTILPFETEKFELVDFLRTQWLENPPTINELQSYQNTIAQEAYGLIAGWDFNIDIYADFSCNSVHGEIPFTVHFTNETLHAPDYISWDFNGDGSIDSTMTYNIGLGADWTYEEAGTYTVTLIAYKDSLVDSLQIENCITASEPGQEYLAASLDTVVCTMEEPFEEEVFLYNIGDYPVTINEYHLTELEGYENPNPGLFDCFFEEMWEQLPKTIEPGDSLLMIVMPLVPVRDYWGENVVLIADLDTLWIPCLYDEELWNNADNQQIEPAISYISAYPNPFNPETTISWQSAVSSEYVEICIFNLKGQLIRRFSELPPSGSVVWKGYNQQNRKTASGIYFCQLYQNNSLLAVKRMLMLK